MGRWSRLPTTPRLFSTESSKSKKTSARPARVFDARSVAGRRVKKISGPARANITGTRLIPEACARPACNAGRKHSASPANAGPYIRTGTGSSAPRVEPMLLDIVDLSRCPPAQACKFRPRQTNAKLNFRRQHGCC